MKTLYKHIGFNEAFTFPPENGLIFIKANHNRGYIPRENGHKEYRYFKKNVVVSADIKSTPLTQFMEVK